MIGALGPPSALGKPRYCSHLLKSRHFANGVGEGYGGQLLSFSLRRPPCLFNYNLIYFFVHLTLADGAHGRWSRQVCLSGSTTCWIVWMVIQLSPENCPENSPEFETNFGTTFGTISIQLKMRNCLKNCPQNCPECTF